MPNFTFNHFLPYPGELNRVASNKTQLIKALDKFTLRNLSLTKKTIREDLLSLYPELVAIEEYAERVSEIVKNIFDSVNTKKIQDTSVAEIKIKIVVIEEKNYLTIKFKDNGLGFQNLKLSKSLELSKYLRENGDSKSVSKSQQKAAGQTYILGGLRVGLADFNDAIQAIGGTISVKNRKLGGASVEMRMPLSKKTIPYPSLDCEDCHVTYKNKNIFWNKKTHEPEAMYCVDCKEMQFFNPFKMTG